MSKIGVTYSEIAQIAKMSTSTAGGILKRYYTTGHVTVGCWGGSKRNELSEIHMNFL
jgi:transposase